VLQHVYLEISRETEVSFENSLCIFKKLPYCVVIINFGELFIAGLRKNNSSAALKSAVFRAEVPLHARCFL